MLWCPTLPPALLQGPRHDRIAEIVQPWQGKIYKSIRSKYYVALYARRLVPWQGSCSLRVPLLRRFFLAFPLQSVKCLAGGASSVLGLCCSAARVLFCTVPANVGPSRGNCGDPSHVAANCPNTTKKSFDTHSQTQDLAGALLCQPSGHCQQVLQLQLIEQNPCSAG